MWARKLYQDHERTLELTHNQDGEQVVSLHIVIEHSNLAILLSCNGNQLLEGYVYSDGGRKDLTHPDVLIYNGKFLSTHTSEIYMVCSAIYWTDK